MNGECKLKVAITTLGCKVNSYESEAVLQNLVQAGHEAVEFTEQSDIYIINTCMVTNTAEAKSRKIIHRPLKLNPDAIVVVMGCLTQLKAQEVLTYPGVKIVLGTSRRDEIGDFIDEYLKTKTPLNKVAVLEKDEQYDNLQLDNSLTHQRAFLKIQDGCNNFCSYCIIPYTRGRVRSKAKELVLKEARRLVEKGHFEIILTGIHTGGYGEDLETDSFFTLLRDMEKVEGLQRIRISSIEITELTDEIIRLIASSKKIVNHLHVPLQGGTDRILKLMNRKYTLSDYRQKILQLRDQIENLAITTDIIAGFPSETDSEHLETLTFVESINFSELHVFPYSKRSGTTSAKMGEDIDSSIKKERVMNLLKLNEILAARYIESQMKTTQQVIAETWSEGFLVGHTSNYIKVKFPGDKSQIGKIINIRITKEQYPLSDAEIV